jgi:hypothetical protein
MEASSSKHQYYESTVLCFVVKQQLPYPERMKASPSDINEFFHV